MTTQHEEHQAFETALTAARSACEPAVTAAIESGDADAVEAIANVIGALPVRVAAEHLVRLRTAVADTEADAAPMIEVERHRLAELGQLRDALDTAVKVSLDASYGDVDYNEVLVPLSRQIHKHQQAYDEAVRAHQKAGEPLTVLRRVIGDLNRQVGYATGRLRTLVGLPETFRAAS